MSGKPFCTRRSISSSNFTAVLHTGHKFKPVSLPMEDETMAYWPPYSLAMCGRRGHPATLLSGHLIIIIMYIYHAPINALSAHMIRINLNTIFYTHVEHSTTKPIYVKYYMKHTHARTHARTHAHTHTHTHRNRQRDRETGRDRQ